MICDLDLWFDLWFAHHWVVLLNHFTDASNQGINTVVQKSKPPCSCHIYIKHWPIFKKILSLSRLDLAEPFDATGGTV